MSEEQMTEESVMFMASAWGRRDGAAWGRTKKVSIDTDLTESSVDWLVADMAETFGDAPEMIIAGVHDQRSAREAAERRGLKLAILPSEILQIDAWALVGKESLIWSPGA